MVAIVLSFILTILNVVLVVAGFAAGSSFEQWVPIDIALIVTNIIYCIIFFSKKRSNTGMVYLAIVGAFLFGFLAHMRLGFWVLLDLAVIGTSIYGIIDSIAARREKIEQKSQSQANLMNRH